MLRKLLFIFVLFIALPCIAEEKSDLLYSDNINMTPQRTFSGYTTGTSNYQNINNIHKSNIYRTYTTQSQKRAEIMKPRSVREIQHYTPKEDDPMTYNKFPQNRDSSDMMHMQQMHHGVQNMFMDF